MNTKCWVGSLAAVAWFASCGGKTETTAEHTAVGGQAGAIDSGLADTGQAGSLGGQAGSGGSKPDAGCQGPNPAGCFYNGIGCPTGSICEHVDCTSSYCSCDPIYGVWGCATDCGGGACVQPASPACAAAITTISSQMKGLACTAVVRVSYLGGEILGYQFVCGPVVTLDEAKARAVAQADTGFGLSGESKAGTKPTDEFVFYESPADFGGVGVVSARNGLSVFGGAIHWMGTGEISWPKSPWQPKEDLGGPECTLSDLPIWRGFDLVGEQAYTDAKAQAALANAWTSALSAGILSKQNLQEAVVLLYARTVGKLDPTTAEWIVLINSEDYEW